MTNHEGDGETSAESQEQRLRNYDPATNLASKVIPKTAEKTALTAAFTLQKYINEPFAHKLEGILTSFGHQKHLEVGKTV